MSSFRAFLYRVRVKGRAEYPENVVTFAQSVLLNPKAPGRDAGEREWKQFMTGAPWDVWRLYNDAWNTYMAEPNNG